MKQIVKTLIILGISAFAIIIGIILIVILNRILKNANNIKRKIIRQKQREIINSTLQEDLREQENEKKNIHKILPQLNGREKTTQSIPVEIPKIKNKSVKNTKKIRNHNTSKTTPKFLENLEDFEILEEKLSLKNLLSKNQLNNIRIKNPNNIKQLIQFVQEEIKSEKHEINILETFFHFDMVPVKMFEKRSLSEEEDDDPRIVEIETIVEEDPEKKKLIGDSAKTTEEIEQKSFIENID